MYAHSVDPRAVSGGVLHMMGQASTSGSGSRCGQGIVYIANSTFARNLVQASPGSVAENSFSTLQGCGG